MDNSLTEIKNRVGSLLSKMLLMSPALNTQDFDTYERGLYTNRKDTLNYRILFPEQFDPQKKYPIVFVLHGSAERGNDNRAQLVNGAELFLQPKNRAQLPAIVVFPQCSKNGYWSNVHITCEADNTQRYNFQIEGEPTADMRLLLGTINEFLDKPFVDTSRVYVGGLSMGGMGVFELLRRLPNVFASAFSICGGDNALNAKVYATKVPLWIFHGEHDTVVPPEHSEKIVAAIEQYGGKPKFSLYKNVGHNSWDNAFAEPGLLPWLFSHSK